MNLLRSLLNLYIGAWQEHITCIGVSATSLQSLHMSVYLNFRLFMCRFSPKCPVTTRLFLLEAKASEVAIITIHSADCVSKSHHCNLRMSQVPSTTPSSCLRRRRTRHRCSTWRRTRAAPWANSSATTASTRSSSTTICPSRLSPTDR